MGASVKLRSRYKTFVKCVFLGIALLIVIGLIFIIRLFYGLAGLPNAYALWDASELITLHIDRTNEWPRNWDDLKPDAEKYPNRGAETFAEIQQRVWIDFSTDLNSLRANEWKDRSSPPFIVVKKISGPGTLWVDRMKKSGDTCTASAALISDSTRRERIANNAFRL